MELGEISVGSEWIRVPLDATFAHPIVVAGPPTGSGTAATSVLRLRNVNAGGFDIRLEGGTASSGSQTPKTVHYLVMEQGRFTLPNGLTVEAGTFAGSADATFTYPSALPFRKHL
jgi:hypothetical protein